MMPWEQWSRDVQREALQRRDCTMSKIIDAHCPGDDPTKKGVPQIFSCPKCGGEVEIWSDERAGTCSSCKERIERKDVEAR